jgi:hypothetical protein
MESVETKKEDKKDKKVVRLSLAKMIPDMELRQVLAVDLFTKSKVELEEPFEQLHDQQDMALFLK